jgi:hypothetical protein
MLMESLRAVGYNIHAALADLIDNSIAAGAENIAIDFDVMTRPCQSALKSFQVTASKSFHLVSPLSAVFYAA